MAHTLDPEVGMALAALFGDTPPPPIAEGDWRQLRQVTDGVLAALAARLPETGDVRATTPLSAPGRPPLRWYERNGERPGAALLYIHGGGMIAGSVALYEPIVASYVQATGVPALAVDYRLAPENRHPAAIDDCMAALHWLVDHAAELGVDPARIAVMGDSAGGGLAAVVAMQARDSGIALARQILLYPMLDDRSSAGDPAIAPFATWTIENNRTAWRAVLGDDAGTDAVPDGATAARVRDLTGVAPAYIEVGDLDIFRDESIAHALRLTGAGVPVELHVHPGVPHFFEFLAPDATVSRRAAADRARVIAEL